MEPTAITLEPDLLARVASYRFDAKLRTNDEAVQRLVEASLKREAIKDRATLIGFYAVYCCIMFVCAECARAILSHFGITN